MSTVIRARDLTVRYGAATALSHVDLHVDRGERVALIGPNGAGKSTFVKTVAGLLRPASGSLLVEGVVGVVPEGRQLFGDLTVEDNLRLGAWRSRDRDPERIYELLPDLRAKARSLGSQLSGGQQQMVAIGRALMADPEVLVIDELSLGLAPIVVSELAAFIVQLSRDRGTTVLLIEQSAKLALRMCDRAYLLDSGEIVAQGTSEQLSTDALEEAYLGFARGEES